jgi:hypothetical protein
MSFVPNEKMTDCIHIKSKDYYSSHKECIDNCTFLHFTPLKYCLKQQCIESCQSVRDRDACLEFCNHEKFFKKTDYDYLFACRHDPEECAKKCRKLIENEFNGSRMNSCQKLPICKDSCQFDPQKKCNDTNDFCWKYDPISKRWNYHVSDRLNKIDNTLFLQVPVHRKGGYICKNNTNKCMWDGALKKKSIDSTLKCYEKKSNCCRDDVICLLSQD